MQRLAHILHLVKKRGSQISNWILKTALWDDTGTWEDNKQWLD